VVAEVVEVHLPVSLNFDQNLIHGVCKFSAVVDRAEALAALADRARIAGLMRQRAYGFVRGD
jgi:hypothetical protein